MHVLNLFDILKMIIAWTNRIIIVLWFLVMVPPSSLRICSMRQWIIIITMFTCKIHVERMLGHAHLYEEQGREGGGGYWRPTNCKIKTFGAGIIGECLIFLKQPPFPPNFQVLPLAQSGSDNSGTGTTGWEEPGADRHALAGSCWRRAVSEGSLQPTVQADPAPRRARGLAREGDITSARERVGGG